MLFYNQLDGLIELEHAADKIAVLLPLFSIKVGPICKHLRQKKKVSNCEKIQRFDTVSSGLDESKIVASVCTV